MAYSRSTTDRAYLRTWSSHVQRGTTVLENYSTFTEVPLSIYIYEVPHNHIAYTGTCNSQDSSNGVMVELFYPFGEWTKLEPIWVAKVAARFVSIITMQPLSTKYTTHLSLPRALHLAHGSGFVTSPAQADRDCHYRDTSRGVHQCARRRRASRPLAVIAVLPVLHPKGV